MKRLTIHDPVPRQPEQADCLRGIVTRRGRPDARLYARGDQCSPAASRQGGDPCPQPFKRRDRAVAGRHRHYGRTESKAVTGHNYAPTLFKRRRQDRDEL